MRMRTTAPPVTPTSGSAHTSTRPAPQRKANDRAAAVTMLQKSVDAGLNEAGWITGDSDLADIQQEPVVRQIVARLTKEAK